MDLSILNELINKPKKTNASKATCKAYIDQIVILLEEKGFSQEAVKYLKGGFSFGGAKPIAIYLRNLPEEKKRDEINCLLQSELFNGNDNPTAFRFGISLFAYSIEWLDNNQQLMIELIRLLPSFSKTKEKVLLKDAPKIFEKYFIDIIGEKTDLPNLNAMGLEEGCIGEFKQLLSTVLQKTSETKSVKTKRFYKWINVVEPNNTGTMNKTKPEKTTGNDNGIQENPVQPLSNEELVQAKTEMISFAKRLEATAKAYEEIKRSYNHIAEERLNLESELKLIQEKMQDKLIKIEKANNEIEQKRVFISELTVKLDNANNTTAKIEQEKAELIEENSNLKSIITVYKTDKQNALTEQLDEIALKLKTEYKDFIDAKEMKMTADLGENFRLQLQTIFKILAKSGINMEKR